MLGVYERGDPPVALSLGYHMESQSGLAAALRPEDFNYPAARHSANSQCQVER